MFVTASIFAAAAWASWVFVAAHILQGMCTSLMLIAAVPAQLVSHPFMSAIAFIPLVGGVAGIAGLIAYEYRIENPLMPIDRLATTFPVAGVIVAMFAGAASVGIIVLTEYAMQSKTSAIHLAMLFWPAFGGARLQDPDLDRWIDQDEPAIDSPPLFAAWRPRAHA